MISSPDGAADETFLSPRRGLTLVIIAYTVGYARAYGTRSPTATIYRTYGACLFADMAARPLQRPFLAAFRVAAISRGHQAAKPRKSVTHGQ